ncbi:MAG: hypothetical protein SOR31_03535 [Parvimonas sp.]|uniref:hypothetical protein n=1 Tax=Parvimonas sp. TaxID=1944660 RepID=UPI002A7492E3|nr:hypothetical protein [Parvimonas sp.]MDY3050689.1 hypothetical protein [Parvimonas sp.]
MESWTKKDFDVLNEIEYFSFQETYTQKQIDLTVKKFNKIIEYILKVYEDFEGAYNFYIIDEFDGEYQGNGEYCSQSTVGYSEDSYRGTYYFPIRNKKYLAVEYEC